MCHAVAPPDRRLSQRAPEGAPPQPVNHPGRPGKARYLDSIESLVRNNIQKMKIDMANEIIDAGRFDQETSMDERRATLEALLQVWGEGVYGSFWGWGGQGTDVERCWAHLGVIVTLGALTERQGWQGESCSRRCHRWEVTGFKQVWW